MKKSKLHQGFSLFKPLFVIAIIGLLIGLVIPGLAPSARAASTVDTNNYGNVAPLAPGVGRLLATNVASGGTVTNNTQFAILFSSTISAQLNLLGLGTGATNTCTATFQVSDDNANWQTIGTMTLTGTGTLTTSVVSNFAAGGAAFARLSTVTSTANGTGTNLNVEVWVNTKPGL